ncbi:hypothetical protein C0991_002899 [Blastosporella zonata]|nr:hypothetical protein C0991_002899 [Blastosporella zonata]
MSFPSLVLVGLMASAILATPLLPPTVQLDGATVTGKASGSVSKFLGIPFAEPPTGDLRFRLPRPIPPYDASFSALDFSLSCPQQSVEIPFLSSLPKIVVEHIYNDIFNGGLPDSEDCTCSLLGGLP